MSIDTAATTDELDTGRVVTLRREEPGIAVITIDAPPANVLTIQARREIGEIFDLLDADDSVRAVLITSAIKVFTAGGDLREDQNLDAADARAYIDGWLGLCERIAEYRAPVIAAINGGALGGGLEFVLSCDIRIASTDAFFVAAGVNVGLIVNFWRLPRLIGLGPAKEILLTGSRISAEQAYNWGLVTELHAPEDLYEAGLAKARRIATRAPLSVEATKYSANRTMDLSAEQSDEFQRQQFVKMFLTEDHQEALRAFFGKRDGDYHRR
ncbi:enoyl-CoA hydratase/isomerase family protein [Nakamurella sp. YIM 132087]|uniref:Enoyl-CoA hydratase/isomerase family protein n=1 Tax=Nakamurella alba TaxID=2665158 RepID=A0A7K1FE37_9ACTN|nr:enoyl-CoA hydratase/isomerase family protein [Nakamurella alba]MTD12330.1 enoyl-CoA hydratase/isomerase family protein [Nakamurella alba]